MRILEEYTTIIENKEVEFRYFYRVITSKYNGIDVYGVQIERKDYKGLVEIGNEKDTIEFVSTQRYKAKQIVMNLCKNQVSPIHLIDILGEFVDEHVYEFDILSSKKVQLI